MAYEALYGLTTVYLPHLSWYHSCLAHYVTATLDLLFLANIKLVPDLGLLILVFPLPRRLFPFR